MTYADIAYSKKLASLFHESEWWWSTTDYNDKHGLPVKVINKNNKKALFKGCIRKYYPALTTDMLLERLPDIISNMISCKYGSFIIVKIKNIKNIDVWTVAYTQENDFGKWPLFKTDKSLPNALALMLIYLKDNDLLKEKNE